MAPSGLGDIRVEPAFRELPGFDTDPLTGDAEELGELALNPLLRGFREARVPSEGDAVGRWVDFLRAGGARDVEVHLPVTGGGLEPSPPGCGPPAPECAPDVIYETPGPQPALGDLTEFQGYLRPGDGVDAAAAWKLAGGRGEGVVVADVESGWSYHYGLWKRLGFVGGLGSREPDDRAHGPAVMGILGARRHGRRRAGIEGLANRARLIAVPAGDGEEKSTSNAILNAIRSPRIPPGSVLLLETQHRIEIQCEDGVRTSSPYLPLEATGEGYRAIRRAVDLGYHVVQAAGNGSTDLGPFLGDRDSGAIMVGGGSHLDGRRVYRSNFGARVDVSSWGSAVVSCGTPHGSFGDLWSRRLESYTASFNSTSSAAAIVAGVVACILGILKAHDVELSPRVLRDYLVRTGNPRQGCPDQPIGPQPDLAKIIGALVEAGLLPAPRLARS
jgi:hypothetical protein